jgi:competence protein ComEC
VFRIAHLDIVAFAAGFVVGTLLHSPAWGIALVGLAASLLHRRVCHVRRFTVAVGLFAATLVLALHESAESVFEAGLVAGPQDLLLRGQLTDGPRVARDFSVYEMDIDRVDHHPMDASVRLYLSGDAEVVAGETVEVFARCSSFGPPELPGNRGAASRWAAHGVDARCASREAPVLVADGFSPRRALTRRRLALEERLRAVLGRRAGVPIAMLTGTRSLVTDSERRAHQRAGTAHLLAISGLHFGALAGIVWFVAGWLLSWSRRVTLTVGARRASAGVVLATMLGYLLLVGAPVSATRACIAVGAIAVALMLGRRASGIPAVSLAAVVMLAYSPGLVWDLGFQLSFVATLAIVLFWQRLPAALRHDAYEFEGSRSRTFVRSLGRFIGMSWAATAATAPILLGATGEMSVVAFLTNLVAVPLVSMGIFPCLLLGAIALEVAPSVGEPLVEFATAAMLRLTELLESAGELPGAVWNPGAPPDWLVVTMCTLVFVALGAALRRRALVGTIAAALVLCVGWHHRPRPQSLRVHFIPVGQGDATLVEMPDNRRILIDAGGSQFDKDPGRAIVVPYLRRLGIGRLDAVIVTHADTDHAGGVPAVLELIDVDRLITELEYLAGMRLERWVATGSKNERSVVATIDTGKAIVVLPGDAERGAEQGWLAREPHRIQVLKVAHHGSRTSSTEVFLSVARPLLAVASAGRHSRFGHPHPDVVERLREGGTRVFATPWNGLVVVEVTRDGRIVARTRR